MATYAVGDVQGCDQTLGRLLRRIDFDAAKDRLWFVGDLVNRGPDNLGVLRRIRDLGERAVCVLGNHDLHLLGRADGQRSAKRLDTLNDVLDAPDREVLVEWLRNRPLVHREGAYTMVHAGLLASWSTDDALGHAAPLEARIRAGDDLFGDETLAVFTRMRFVAADGRPDYEPKCEPEGAPHHRPWFDVRPRESGVTVLFGHWAALGLSLTPGYVGLDTGCVWGGALTAYRLEDGAVFAEPSQLGPDTAAG